METSVKTDVTIIGAGHMGTALAEGFLRSKISVVMSTPHPGKVNASLKKRAMVMSDNVKAVSKADVLILAVKPALLPQVLAEIRDASQGKVLVSVAAGVSRASLKKAIGKGIRAARIMPNLPVALGDGVVGFFPGDVTNSEKRKLMTLFESLGSVVSVSKEKELDALTLISGCGPGIVAHLVGLFAAEARARGFSEKQAEEIALHTFSGTLAHLKAGNISPLALEKAVATTGGVTESILNALKQNGFDRGFTSAMKTGMKRIRRIKG